MRTAAHKRIATKALQAAVSDYIGRKTMFCEDNPMIWGAGLEDQIAALSGITVHLDNGYAYEAVAKDEIIQDILEVAAASGHAADWHNATTIHFYEI